MAKGRGLTLNLKAFLPNRKVLSLDIGAYEIKVVEGKHTKKGIIIDNHFTIPMPKKAYDNGKIVDKDLIYYVIKEELKKNNIKTKNTYLTINNPSIIAREVIIPKVADEEIYNVLSYQFEDYIPMNPENYIIQYKIIDLIYEENIAKLNILIIAIPKEIVESHYQLLVDLGLNPLILDYQPNSVAKLIGGSDYINDNYPTKDLTFAVIDIGYDSSKVSIIRNGVIFVSRIIEIGGKYIDKSILNFFQYNDDELTRIKEEIIDINHIDEKDLYNSQINNIIKNSLEALNERIEVIFRYFITREVENNIDMILLLGGVLNISGIANYYSNYFNISSIKLETIDNLVFQGEIFKYINSIGSIIRETGV